MKQHSAEGSTAAVPKYQEIIEQLKHSISSGKYGMGDRLPSEHELVKTFGTSRVTVNRALRELQLAGYIDRRAGSGSYVRRDLARGHTFGLLIPELGRTEIFEPICRGMARAQRDEQHALLWGESLPDSDHREQQVESVCRQLVSKKVSGVFFAPLELAPEKEVINRLIAEIFDDARIPIVLLDRDLVAYPERSRYDLVGIDNRRAGYVITDHLIRSGCQRLVFIGRPGSAPTVEARIAGFKEALLNSDVKFGSESVARIDPSDLKQVRRLMDHARPDGIVCANDFSAAQLMQVLGEMGVAVPKDVKLAGIDDVRYASLLPVPLTTIHQPCAEMGASAIDTMVQRLQHPDLPARDILLTFHLVVRRSTSDISEPAR